MKTKKIISLIVLGMSIILTSCGGATSDDAMFNITGMADVSFSSQSLGSIESMDVEYTEKDGSITTFTGFPMASVIDLAGISDYSTVTMIAVDAYTAEVTADELAACETCIVALDNEGAWRTVMPGFSGKLQVKDLVELKIQ